MVKLARTKYAGDPSGKFHVGFEFCGEPTVPVLIGPLQPCRRLLTPGTCITGQLLSQTTAASVEDRMLLVTAAGPAAKKKVTMTDMITAVVSGVCDKSAGDRRLGVDSSYHHSRRHQQDDDTDCWPLLLLLLLLRR